MSRETRTVRPFVGLGAIEAVLEGTSVHFGNESCLANQGITVDLAPHEFLLRPVSIEWAADDRAHEKFLDEVRHGVDAVGLNEEDLSLVVIASTPFLKAADIVFERRASELADVGRITNLTSTSRAESFSAPFSGFTVDAYILLNRRLKKRGLRPHLRGTWLARAQYRVSTTQGPAFLPPTPLTKEDRDRLSLPRKTLRYVYLGDHDLLSDYRSQEQPTFYVDEDLLSQMNARRRSGASRALQLQLAHDFASTVVRRAASHPEIREVAYADLRNTLLGSVLRLGAGPGATDDDMNRLIGELQNDPDLVVARIEHFIDLSSGYQDLLEEQDS